MSVFAVMRQVFCHPIQYLVVRWNWKAALFSPVLRALIFFFTNLTAGWKAALAAATVELLYRGPAAGVYGALTQAFRNANPAWAAGLTVMVLLPVLSHSLEAGIHFLRGTPKLGASIIASVCFTAISTLFNLYAMRRGLLLTGSSDAGTFWSDMRKIPLTIGLFAAAGPLAIWRAVRWLLALPSNRPASFTRVPAESDIAS